jgi:hypothetical protein
LDLIEEKDKRVEIFLPPNSKAEHIKMSTKKQPENDRKAGGNQAVLNSIGISGYSVGTVGNTAESELRGGFFSQVHGR